ncbi:MAG TPA: BatA and WFA domain-containing protein [bacterium]|nr:BatA and WFA domain-containing protein [bacterium]
MLNFTYPIAFLGLISVLALIAFYFFRNRFQRKSVSSLLLWKFMARPREGGPRLNRPVMPLTFFLELLALILIVMAAVDPRWHLIGNQPPLFVVLDNSASMLAGGSHSPRERAGKYFLQAVRKSGNRTVRCIVAGEEPLLTGTFSISHGSAAEVLRQWQCGSRMACLEDGVSLGLESSGKDVDIMVLTDHAPPSGITENSRIKWVAFGKLFPNAGITGGTRRSLRDKEKVFLQIASFSPWRTRMEIIADDGKNRELARQNIVLKPGECKQTVFEIPPRIPMLHIWLKTGDNFETDDHAYLISEDKKPVRVLSKIGNAKLKKIFEKALDASDMRSKLTDNPQILITDQVGQGAIDDFTWNVRVTGSSGARAYAGPFVCDMNHPLMTGTNLTSAIWGGGEQAELPGIPVVTAGNVPLITDQIFPSGRHDLHFVFNPGLSTLQNTPNFPVIVWNLLRWRASESPGFTEANVRLGDHAILIPEQETDVYRVVSPKGGESTARTDGGRLAVQADETGFWRISGKSGTYDFACNLFSPGESDLTGSVSGQWGNFVDPETVRKEYVSTSWLWILLSLAVLAVHLKVLANRKG